MQSIVFFDGVCNLCNNSVDFIIRRDHKARFTFASLQSQVAQKLLEKHQFSTSELTTMVLLKEGKIYTHSSAALEICRHLNGGWPVLYVFKIVPPFIRDAVYGWISKNRYRWFGKRDTCRVPEPHEKVRFLDNGPLDWAQVS